MPAETFGKRLREARELPLRMRRDDLYVQTVSEIPGVPVGTVICRYCHDTHAPSAGASGACLVTGPRAPEKRSPIGRAFYEFCETNGFLGRKGSEVGR